MTNRLGSGLLLCLFGGAFLLTAQGGPDDTDDPMAGATYVGDAKCRMCHLKVHRGWTRMKHAGAWNVLQKEHREPTAKDADGRACISCHVTGYGEADRGGFKDAETSKHLLGVQCEACHGPGSKHHDTAKELQAAKKDFAPDAPKFIVRRTTKCADCHNVHVDHAKYAAKADDSD